MSASAAAAARQERAAQLAHEPEPEPEPEPVGSLLRAAALAGDAAQAKLPASAPDSYGDSALHLAARSGQASILAALASGVDVDRRSAAGATPLWLACFHGHREVAELLLERGAQPERPHGVIGSAPLAAAAAQGHLPLVRLLVLEHSAEVDRANKNGRTALWSAAYEGHAAVVRFLLERGAGTGRKSRAGHTPFSAAAEMRDAPPQAHEYENGPRPHSPERRGRYMAVLEALAEATRPEDRSPAIAEQKLFMGCTPPGAGR